MLFEQLNASFTEGSPYGFIRHAQVLDPLIRDPVIQENSLDYLQLVCERLLVMIPQAKVAVFHSPPPRAAISAGITRKFFMNSKQVVARKELDWLEFMEYEGPNTINGWVAPLLVEYPDTFLIFVSHQEDIAAFLQAPNSQVQHCSFFSRDFWLRGHEKFE